MSLATSHRDVKRRLAAAALLAATIWLPAVSSPPVVQAAAVCTGWSSTTTPPPTIRVLRTGTGVVETVDFMTYVKVVMPAEWPSTWSQEVFRAGAVAIKQYAWYYTMHYRGGTGTGGCYDVRDDSWDQVYSPTRTQYANQIQAVESTWSESITKGGAFVFTGYRPGTNVACGTDAHTLGGNYLMQRSALNCATDGKTGEEILQIYYGPGLVIQVPTTYHALTPARILDTRDGTGLSGLFSSYVARTFGVAGRGGVPTNATAVTGNLTVTQQTALGYLYIGPNATNNPTSSTLNFPLADDRANGVTVALGGTGTLSVTYVAVPGATAQVIFDVTGYFVPSLGTWTLDVYDARADRWQNPDFTACTAAATESMLNTITWAGSASGFVWQPNTTYDMQESILAFERGNMTMLDSSAGSDPHGWRNALNYYGWGSIDAGVYRDSSYSSFDAATKAAVSALATHHKPVGILARSGTHGQFITGYQVTGADPSTGSSNFTIVGVDLTDPLQSVGYRDTWITIADWSSGGTWIRFSQYLETDSPYADPIDGQIGKSEWYGKWVIIDPVK